MSLVIVYFWCDLYAIHQTFDATDAHSFASVKVKDDAEALEDAKSVSRSMFTLTSVEEQPEEGEEDLRSDEESDEELQKLSVAAITISAVYKVGDKKKNE